MRAARISGRPRHFAMPESERTAPTWWEVAASLVAFPAGAVRSLSGMRVPGTPRRCAPRARSAIVGCARACGAAPHVGADSAGFCTDPQPVSTI